MHQINIIILQFINHKTMRNEDKISFIVFNENLDL